MSETANRYRKTGKKDTRRFLDEFVALTDYSRSYAARVLRDAEKRRYRPAARGNAAGKRFYGARAALTS